MVTTSVAKDGFEGILFLGDGTDRGIHVFGYFLRYRAGPLPFRQRGPVR